MQKLQGVVVRESKSKTARVEVVSIVNHPVYKKRMRRHAEYLVHDENNTLQKGDSVEIFLSRPISKLKRWSLVRVIRGAL